MTMPVLSWSDQGGAGSGNTPGAADAAAEDERMNRVLDARERRTQNNSNQTSSKGTECAQLLTQVRNLKPIVDPTTQQPKTPEPQIDSVENVKGCAALKMASDKLGLGGLTAGKDTATTTDRRINCVMKAGYTFDWESCKSAVSAYNQVMIAEKVLFAAQGTSLNATQEKAAQDVAQRSTTGDGQAASYDAAIKVNTAKKELNQQQLAAYGLAVAYLGSKLTGWQGKSDSALAKKCNSSSSQNTRTNAPANTPATIVTEQKWVAEENANCAKAMRDAVNFSPAEAFANGDAKAALLSAILEFATKAAQAGVRADQLGNVAKQIADVKAANDEVVDSVIDPCVTNISAPGCVKAGDRVSQNAVVGDDFQAGEGFAGNNFGSGTAETPFGEAGELGTPSDLGKVADANSPFADEAKAANGILNPAAAASVTPGGAPGGGGGAGGGGLGGGGSASLGSDLQGEDKNTKEKEIDPNKIGGSYSGGGGAKFGAVKDMKDDGNPFSSLFDGKGGGGIEEDRSIASDDGGKDSGIFQKISNRYGQIQAEKRIEANNLE